MNYFFTADEHYGHKNIIKYCNRPFADVNKMDEFIISNHNEVVKDSDLVIHAGDFTLTNKHIAGEYIKRLNGKHIFVKGSHDKWSQNLPWIYNITIEKQLIIVCHYAMRRWPRSHYGAWHVYGHSHGKLLPYGLSWDVGVDNNNFCPVSYDQLKEIMNKLLPGEQIYG